MSRAPNHYEVLGVPPSASEATIRRAYRALARTHHPDVSRDPEAQERFGRIAEAYEVLSNAVRRRSYDRSLREETTRLRPETEPPRPASAPHYTWTNVAGDAYTKPDRTELDEMYDAFFGSDGPDSTDTA